MYHPDVADEDDAMDSVPGTATRATEFCPRSFPRIWKPVSRSQLEWGTGPFSGGNQGPELQRNPGVDIDAGVFFFRLRYFSKTIFCDFCCRPNRACTKYTPDGSVGAGRHLIS